MGAPYLTYCPHCYSDYEYGNEQASREYEHSTCEDAAVTAPVSSRTLKELAERKQDSPDVRWIRETFYATAPLAPDYALSAEESYTMPSYDNRLVVAKRDDWIILLDSEDSTIIHVIRRVTEADLTGGKR